jgi:hypothetical protein
MKGQMNMETSKEYDINRPWLTLDKWQKEYIETKPEIDCFILSPRQIGGKTTAMSIKAVELCQKYFKKGEMILISSLTERQAMLMLKKAQIYAEQVYPKTIDNSKDNKPTMHRLIFKNGSGILCYAAGQEGDSTRGYTIKKLMVDEGSRMEEEYFVSALPTLSLTKGSMDIASTPFGKKDKEGNEKFFYRCYKDDSFKKFIIRMEDCPRRDEEMIEKMKQRLSKRQFAQEFLNSFEDEINALIDEDLIKKVCKLKRREEFINGTYYLGVDVAGFGDDLSTYEILDKKDNGIIQQVENITERRNLTTETTKKILELENIYNFKKIGVDDGGIGFGVFSELLSEEKTKRKTIALNNASRQISSKGLKFKRLLKEEMYLNLLSLIENNKIELLNDDEIKDSLRSIQYDEGKIYSPNAHIVEGIIRAAWLAVEDKDLKPFVYSF